MKIVNPYGFPIYRVVKFEFFAISSLFKGEKWTRARRVPGSGMFGVWNGPFFLSPFAVFGVKNTKYTKFENKYLL